MSADFDLVWCAKRPAKRNEPSRDAPRGSTPNLRSERPQSRLTERHLHCPWCGEGFDAFVDLSYGESEYVEDCPVCCRPITLSLRVDGDGELEDLGVDRE